MSPRKPSVALVVDSETWAFANIARQLMKHLSEHFSFRMIPVAVVENIDQLLMMTEDADLRHFFWREIPRQIGTPYYRSYIERLGCDYQLFEERFLKSRRLTTAVYDHLFLADDEIAERAPFFASPLLDAYSVSSRRLYDIYRSLPGYPLPLAILADGVDLDVFTPRRLDRLAFNAERSLVVGWVGNSAWSGEIEDFKGVHSILAPALDALRSNGAAVQSHFADRAVRFIAHSEMPNYYAQIDLLVCVSKAEGTPNPVLEAMACGVPIVTTDVGVVQELFGPRQRQFILAERTTETLIDRIAELASHPRLLNELSRENLDYVRAWGWEEKSMEFKSFFDAVLDG